MGGISCLGSSLAMSPFQLHGLERFFPSDDAVLQACLDRQHSHTESKRRHHIWCEADIVGLKGLAVIQDYERHISFNCR